MGDNLSRALCSSRTGGKVSGFSLFPLKTAGVRREQSWLLSFPFPHSAELRKDVWLSCEEIWAGSILHFSAEGVDSLLFTERRGSTSLLH